MSDREDRPDRPHRPVAGRPARPTLRQVAAGAGVSVATASYVLSGRQGKSRGASEAASRRVLDVAAELGYLPNQAARAVRTGRTKVILLSLTMLSDPWSQSVVDAVVPLAAEVGLTALILGDADWSTGLEHVDADAVFIDAAADSDRPRLSELARRTRLVVFADDIEPDGFDVVRSLDLPGCRLAMGHLLSGHTRIGCLAAVSATGRRGARFGVWRDAMVAAGLRPAEDLVADYRSDEVSAYAAALTLLSRPEPPTAIFAVTDFAAMSAINAAQRLGLRVPEDVAVIGVGNASQAARLRPSLSSVGPVDLFDRLARLLLRRAQGDDSPASRHDFIWQLFARESTGQTTNELNPSMRS